MELHIFLHRISYLNTIEEVKDKLGKLSDKLEEQKAEETAPETSQEETAIPADSE